MARDRNQREHFDWVARGYNRAIPGHIAEHYLTKRMDFILERIARPARILDIGCGTGRLGGRLLMMGFEVAGLDSSAEMLRIARGKNLLSTQGSADCLPFANETFDASISVAVLHHIAEERLVRQSIMEMVRVTRRGGLIVIWDHNPLNPYWPLIMRRVPQDIGAERLIPMGEILADLGHGRIAEIETFRMGFVPDFVPQGLLPLFQKMERILENSLLTRSLAAHNVVMARRA